MSCSYTVIGSRQTTMLNPLGGYMAAQEVTIQPSKGGIQKFVIPMSEFTPEKVKAEADKVCATLDAIFSSGS